MTRTMPGDAEERSDARGAGLGLEPVPLLHLAAAERLRVTVDADGADIARESARKAFGNVRFCTSPK